jgi:serine phosphatase RsbU (regulator of sigma subunit)/anti-sigma regulatory factor (Ser/Thr protein kinase)
MTITPYVSIVGTTFQSSFPCDLKEVRQATKAAAGFLAGEGLSQEELLACEMALAEACNNAIQYASDDGRTKPVEIAVTCNRSKVELRISDHTPGFLLPARVALPEPESDRGRGLFLIHSLMDQVDYFRAPGKNTLVLRLIRTSQTTLHHETNSQTDLKQANLKLVESEQTIRNMAKELCFRSESLAAIFRCSAELGHANSVEDFSEGLLHDLLDIIFADWFVLRVVRQNGARLAVLAVSDPVMDLEPLAISAAPESTHSIEIKAATSGKDVFFDRDEPMSTDDPLSAAVGWDSHGLVRPLFMGQTLTGTLTVGKADALQSPFTATQLQVVRIFADYLAIHIVNAKFQEERITNRLISREMEIAKNIQRALLPKSLPSLKNFRLAGFCESAREVGGDFYDVLSLSEDTLLLIVADVMGKGVPAAMFAAVFAATVRGLVLASPGWARRPSLLLSRVNRQMAEELSNVDMFITAQLVFVDIAKRELVAASAGHCPLLMGAVHKNAVLAVSPEGIPLGILSNATFTDEIIVLEKGFRVLLYTDGLTEARDAQGQFFGQERLISLFRQSLAGNQTAEQLKEQITAESRRFKSDTVLHDDQAFLIIAEEEIKTLNHDGRIPRAAEQVV